MSKETVKLMRWRDKHLNSVSPSFCAAKWYNASLHLGHGYTNSCHLPLPHPIDLEEIKTNPSALHNTQHKKKVRKMMLEGRRPAECSYCWKVEDISRDTIGDRVFKSKPYSHEDIAKIKDNTWDANITPKTLEVSFDRTCNFACSYCNSGYSTTWGKEMVKNGPYQKFKTHSAAAYHTTGKWAEPYGKDSDDNPYVDAFLRWWPKLALELQEIRITGGEPSQSKNFWNFLKEIKKFPAPNMRLAVNSNLGVSENLMNRLIKVTHDIDVKEFDIYTSCEAFGEHAEYIRGGLVWDVWRNNLIRIIEEANTRQVIVMMTINSLCLFSITEFLDDMMSLKKKYGWNKPMVDLNILRWPAFMSPLNLPDDLKVELHAKLLKWHNDNNSNHRYLDHERVQVKRLIDYIDVVEQGHVKTEEEKEKHFHDFKSFYEQYDKRRGKDFRKTFPYPKLIEWYDSIEVDQSIPDVKLNDGRLTQYEIGEYEVDIERRKEAAKSGKKLIPHWKKMKMKKIL